MSESGAAPVGVLALQGDFARHRQAFARLQVPTRPVRRPGELAGCRGLVIPGGESTTLSRLLERSGLRKAIQAFAGAHPVMGTCAGLILMARELEPEPGGVVHGVGPLGLLDCRVRRNGYGRQVDSFSEVLSWRVEPPPANGGFPAVFIRAPRILAVGPEVETLLARGEEPVAIRQDRLLGIAFHPELTGDTRLHELFLAL